MVCSLCGQRKAKRACPALGHRICAVCCGTKRLVEINCPADCVYLTTARSHPPAVEQRQQEHDRAHLLPLLQDLAERQARLFLMFGTLISRHQSEQLQKLVDEDIGQAAEALAATLETAGRGIVYEHRPASLAAERLLTELKVAVTDLAHEAGSSLERDAAIALRRIEGAAKDTAKAQPGSTAFQQLLTRVLLPPGGPAVPGAPGNNDPPADRAAPASSLIIP